MAKDGFNGYKQKKAEKPKKVYSSTRVKQRDSVLPHMEDYLVFVILSDMNGRNLYHLHPLIVKKNLRTNAITSVSQRAAFHDLVDWKEIMVILQKYRKNYGIGGADIIVTNVQKLKKTGAVFYDLFNPPNESDLISEYQQVFDKIKLAQLRPQPLNVSSSAESAIYLDQEKSPRVFRIDYSVIKIHTLSIMFAIHAVRQSRIREAIKAITGDKYATVRHNNSKLATSNK